MFTGADIGNTVIALEESMYVAKTLDINQTGQYTLLNRDQTENFQ